LGEIEKTIRHESYVPNSRLPNFKEVAESWLASKKSSLRHSTYDQYAGHLKCHLIPYFGDKRIARVNFDAAEQFKNQSLENGVTVPTLRKILINLGAIMTYAVRMRYIDHNPVRDIEKPKGHSTHDGSDEMVILKPDDIRALLDAAGTEKDRVLFLSAVLTGAREGELLGLKWDDFDWRNGQVYIRRSYNHGRFYEPKTKTSRRKIDLAPELIAALKRWKIQCPVSELELVFPTEVGTPEQAPNMFYRRFLPALRRAGLPRIRFHNLRHTYASLLIAQGEHPKYIQSQMGHSSITVTMDTYGHLMNTVNRDAASRLGEQVLGSSFSGHGSSLVAKIEKGVSE
jgi:integrase